MISKLTGSPFRYYPIFSVLLFSLVSSCLLLLFQFPYPYPNKWYFCWNWSLMHIYAHYLFLNYVYKLVLVGVHLTVISRFGKSTEEVVSDVQGLNVKCTWDSLDYKSIWNYFICEEGKNWDSLFLKENRKEKTNENTVTS